MRIGWRKPFIACIALAFNPVPSMAAGTNGNVVPLSSTCIVKAAHGYDLHTDILLAILMVEGGTVGANSKPNDNGSYDIGPFQINSIHRSKLKEMGISEAELRDNGCMNAAVAAWHLHSVLTPEVLESITDQDSYLSAIARYHSTTPTYNHIYANKLKAAFGKLYSQDAQ
jgi:hypothetical protein